MEGKSYSQRLEKLKTNNRAVFKSILDERKEKKWKKRKLTNILEDSFYYGTKDASKLQANKPVVCILMNDLIIKGD